MQYRWNISVEFDDLTVSYYGSLSFLLLFVRGKGIVSPVIDPIYSIPRAL